MKTHENSLQTAGRYAGKALKVGAWGLAGWGLYRTFKESNRLEDFGHETGLLHPTEGSVADTVANNEVFVQLLEEKYARWMSLKQELDQRQAPLEHYCRVAAEHFLTDDGGIGEIPEMSLVGLLNQVKYPNLEHQKRLQPIMAENWEWVAKYEQWQQSEGRATLLKNNQEAADYLLANGYGHLVPIKPVSRQNWVQWALVGLGGFLSLLSSSWIPVIVLGIFALLVPLFNLSQRKASRNAHYREMTPTERKALRKDHALVLAGVLVVLGIIHFDVLFGRDGLVIILFKTVGLAFGFNFAG